MGACSCAPIAEQTVPEKVSKAIFDAGINKADLRILPRSMLQQVIELNALAMCGTATCDPEAICSYIVSNGPLAEYSHPMRLEVMKYLATIEMTRHWERFPDAFTLGGYHEGGLGACCTVVPMYHGYAATETWQMEVLPYIVSAKLLLTGNAPGAYYKNEYRAWRKAFIRKTFGSSGMAAMQTRTHTKYGALPHYYIAMMMVNPSFQGKGLCGRLMRAACRAADAEGLPCYLETGGERNVAVYKRFGFRVLEQTSVSAKGYDSYDDVYLMIRDAVAADGPAKGS
mmetsp:Transcript_45152/g.104625  ORF Transcript_45152/g.104625 Transcript_45152/m.104625 type:complete len:284 (+) Transcript_45152:50-901(+)